MLYICIVNRSINIFYFLNQYAENAKNVSNSSNDLIKKNFKNKDKKKQKTKTKTKQKQQKSQNK